MFDWVLNLIIFIVLLTVWS